MVEGGPSAVYLYKLLPPRPSFASDMSSDEATIMQRHAAYWSAQLERGTVVAFGPVREPTGTWGAGIVEARDAAHAEALAREDPAVQSGMCTFELHPMPRAVVRPFFTPGPGASDPPARRPASL